MTRERALGFLLGFYYNDERLDSETKRLLRQAIDRLYNPAEGDL